MLLDKIEKERIKEIYKNFKWTPVMRNWKEFKDKYCSKYGENTIIFFQLGTFFECYFEDAYITSKLIGQTLTSKNKNDKFAAPMSGSPINAGRNKIKTLLEKNYNVIVVEEINENDKIRREVTDIFTPGTYNDINGVENKYIYSILKGVDKYYVSLIEPTSNILYAVEIKEENLSFLFSLFEIYKPKEILIDNNIKKNTFKSFVCNIIVISDINNIKNIKESYILEKLGNSPILRQSLNVLFDYIEEIYKKKLSNVRELNIINENDFFFLDKNTIKNLEILKNTNGMVENSLLEILRHTLTAMGNRLLKEFLVKPLTNINKIKERQKVIEIFIDSSKGSIKNKIIGNLLGINDIERLASKLLIDKIAPLEIISLRKSLMSYNLLIKNINNINIKEESFLLKDFINKKENFTDIIDLIEKTLKDQGSNNIKEGNIIKEGYNKDLDKIIYLIENKDEGYKKYESEIKKITNNNNIKIIYNNLGAFIEVSKKNKVNIPDDWVRVKILKDTNRYQTKELNNIYNRQEGLIRKRKQLELLLFNKLRVRLSPYIYKIQLVAKKIAIIDVLLSFSIHAQQNNYNKPTIDNSNNIIIKEGRHPVIESLTLFSSNSTCLEEKKIQLITGLNMGGKSTYIRQVALIVLLAHVGSYIPSNKGSIIGLVDGIFTRIGAYDNLSDGESTFFIEAKETAHILKRATSKSLIILDELGRGTSFEDGEALSKSILAYLNYKSIKTLFATHFHNLIKLECKNNNIKNYHFSAEIKKDKILFNHRLKEGGSENSYGLEIAQLAGIPKGIINIAKKMKGQNIIY